ncbi:MAG: tail fiber domain-containing protein, partial [Candidatus Moranbacteria bacterium]|nr:tail fiber domain-containing protein [Candidatus Moranbacteria bacterium]
VTSTGTWDGTSAVNRGLYVNATGGTTNYSAIFEGGNVGIGTTSPSQKLHVVNNSGNAIWGEGSSTGVYGSTTSWAGVQGEANGSGTPFVGYLTYASTNTPEILMRLDRRSSNTPAVGMGGFIGFYSQDASSNYESAADIGFLMTNVTHGSEASDIFFKTRSGGGNPSEKMRITGTGSVGIGTTSPSYALDIKARSTVGDETFTGSGLDDMDSGGTFIGSSALNYRIQIDGTGTPDTFKWSDDGGSTWDATLVAITGSAQTLNNGVTVTFGATTGHTSDDRWDFSTTVTNPLAIQNAAGTRSLYVGNDGLVGIGTTSPGAKLDITGTSNATQFIVRANATQSNSNPLIKAFDSSGNELLRIHSDNSYNLFFGKGAGNANNISGVGTEGLDNSFFGGQAGQSNTTGQANTAFGSAALRDNTTGYGNTAFGRSVLIGLNGGNSNTVFGAGAGGSLTTGSGNILIGENVDAPTATTDNFLNIGNTIYGNLSTGKVGIGTASFGTNNKFLVNPYNTVDNLATAQISTTVATNKGLVIQGFTSQSANLQEWQSSVGTAVSYINAAGDFVHGNFTLGTNSISMSGYPTYFQWGNGQKLEDNGGGGLRMSSLYALDIEADTDNDGTNGIAGNSYINFKTRSTSRLFVDNNGYIGIGNTSPSQGLEVGSTTNGLNAKITAAIGVTNLITNGTFVSDLSSWTPSGGWAWSAGTAKNDGTGGYLTQQFSKTVGKQYKITFDVVGGTAGKLYIGQGANTFEKDPGSASYTEQFKALTDQELYFYSQGFDGAVDNVVIYELTNGNLAVDGDITLSGSITGNSATIGMVPATNGNFGFGTYYARDKVTVNGNIRTQGGSIFLGGDDEVTGIGTVTSTGQLKIFDYQIIRFGFMSSGSFDEKFTMTPTGLGIGTTSPSNKLHVQGTDTGSAGIYLNDATPGTTTTTLYNDGGDLYWGTTNLSSSGTSLWETGAYGTYEDDDDVIVGTAGDETLANTGFVLGGDDLFVAGMAGVEGNIYTDGSFIAGSTTTYGNGSITLSTGTDLNIDSNTLYIDNANNRIGIGTSSPSEQLAIRSNSYFDTVYFYNGSSYTDDTTESRTSGGTAFWVLSSTSHYFYTGKDSTFTTIYLDFAVAGAGVTRSVQYWNGSTWTALTHTDGTSNLSTDGAITFTAPGDWAQTAVNGTTRYWVRISTTSMPTAGITAYFTVPDSTTRLGIYEYGDSSPAFSIGKNWNLNIPTGATYQMAGTNVLRISGAVSSFFAGPNAGRVNTESGTQNVFVGVDAGYTNTSGTDNVFVGRSAGYNNTTGAANVFVGWQAGFTNSNATGSTYVGDYAGQSSNAVDNTMVGKWAGQSNTNGGYNTYLGSQAGRNGTSNINYSTIIGYAAGNSNTGSMNLMVGAQAGMSNTGSYNVFLGNSAGTSTTGSYNAFLGYQAGQANTGGDYGTFLGYQAGITNTSGDYNTFIGYRAGNNNSTGASNVFLGYQAGFSETGSNKLYIANTNTAAPLILGDFNASVGSGLTASITGITINANGTSSTASLTKTGLDIEATGTWNGTSAVNRALYATATGGTNNYAAIFDQGSVGIGTTSPGTKMEVVTVSSGDGIRIKNGGVSVLSLYSTYADSSNRNWGIMTSYDNFGDFALRGSNAQNGDPFGAGTTMFVINKNGSVGIGTTAPGAKLDVLYGESATTAGSYYGMRSDTNSTGIFTTGTTYMYGMYGDAASTGVSTGGTVNTYGGYFTATGENTGAATTNAYGLYVNGATGADNNYSAVFMNGSVGIGTTGPSEKLEVSGNVLLSGGSDRTISVGGSGTYDLTIQGSAYGATGPGGDINIIGGSGLSGGDIYINGGNGGTGVGDVILANDRGNVGIGTASPSAKLDLLYGESATTAGTYRGIRSDINSTGVFTTGFPTIVGVYGDASATGVSTGGTVRTVGGYFVAAGENTGAATTRAYGIYVDGASGADSNYSAAFLNGNVGIGTNAPGYLLTVEGEPGAAGYTHFTSYSDARLKENVVVLGEGYLDKIMQLKPSTFNYNSLTGYDEATRQRRITGFIAQELQTVFPEMVGHTEINGTDYLDTNLSALPLYIVKAMQEQQVQIGDLDTEDQRISTNVETLALKTDESVTNLAELQTSVDEQLAIIGEQLTTNNQQLTTLNSRVSNLEAGIMDQESRIVTLENLVATLQTQIDELKALTNQELNVAQIEANKNDIDYLKLLLGIDRTTNPGDVNILGKVEAEGVVAGAFTVKVSDEEKKTIGSNYIQAIEKDADGDGKDDVTGSDGKSYAVKTKAVSETCKIFTSFEDNPNGYNWVEKVKNDDGEYIGFKMVLSDPVAKDIYFNWWIVESAELGSGN